MKPYFALAARAAALFTFASIMTACGGGSAGPDVGTAAESMSAQQAVPAEAGAQVGATDRNTVFALGAAQMAPVASNPGELVVRAHAVLAGGVGPLMQVIVDDIVIDEIEVRATLPQDYRFSAPSLREGSKVELVYTNKAKVNGVDRILIITQLTAGNTYLFPNDAGAVYDRGSGAYAFDGADVVAGQGYMSRNGALRLSWPAPNLTSAITVRAGGRVVSDVGPVMQLRVDGVLSSSIEVRSTEAADFVFAIPPLKVDSKVEVLLENHVSAPSGGRDLMVQYLIAGDTFLTPQNPSVVFDAGVGSAAFDGQDTRPTDGTLTANGAMRGRWPTPNLTQSVIVRARGTPAGGVYPILQLRVDGIVVASTEVRASSATDHVFMTQTLRVGSQIDVVYANDSAVAGEDRRLSVYYVKSGDTFVASTGADVVFDRGAGAAAFDGQQVGAGAIEITDNGALRMVWPEQNMTSRLIVRARGNLAANVGPVMEVRVDGVIIGAVEVRATDYTDYRFTIPPLRAGSSVAVAYVNDGNPAGSGRKLTVSSVVSETTSMTPVSPGVTYDRGNAESAYDGLDVLPGQRTLYWNGALRFPWPEPNFTDTLNVRASATLAGNVGPMMQLRVDGMAVAEFEVRAAALSDHLVPVPPLATGTKVDVVYLNDATIGGENRGLTIGYLMAGTTVAVPTAGYATYDRGSGSAAFDGVDVVAGQTELGTNGALRVTWPAPNFSDTVIVRARGTTLGGVGPTMQLRVNGVIVGSVSITSNEDQDYSFSTPPVAQGSRIDVVFTNNAESGGEDRNLFVRYVRANGTTLLPTAPTVVIDSGSDEWAFDGANTSAGAEGLYSNGAMRFVLPAPPPPASEMQAKYAASRFLQQATFGPTLAEIDRLGSMSLSAWLDQQIAMPPSALYVDNVQAKFDLGDDYRPGGSKYSINWVGRRFWAAAATSSDQLRQRVAFALHQIFMVSQNDTNLGNHVRAYASYMDALNRHAFGNFRNLLEDIALSPAMGIYLSHMRNRPEDADAGRLPDENFAREVMQLFSIGLYELNSDGTLKLNASGKPIETYTNDDVMALAKVFTGWSWAFPDSELNETNFRWGNPDYSVANDKRIDILPMKPYPDQHSPAEKRLFSGTSRAVTIPAHSSARDSLRIALDALFRHPNVGPFIARQLIQRLVTSHPSPAYVGRVASKFNNNGAGVRGDMAAVVRAVLLDSEARTPPASDVGKVREPILRVGHWMRSFDATSASGEYMLTGELETQSQRALRSPSVFGYFRPGYVPPNTQFSASATTVPEMQIVNEATTAYWANMAPAMAGSGLGSYNGARDVSTGLPSLLPLAAAGDVDALVERINLLLLAGQMSPELRADLIHAVTGVSGNSSTTHLNRARIALMLSLLSPEYLVQR